MNVYKEEIVDFLKSTQLHVPLYQRNYRCKQKFWRDLFNDLLYFSKLKDTEKSPYFLGCIILYLKHYEADSIIKSYFIVDGQQRLITLALLLKAISFLWNERKIEEKDIKSPLEIEKDMKGKRGLVLNNVEDKKVFDAIINNKRVKNEKKTTIDDCYDFFVKNLNDLDNKKLMSFYKSF